jgi:uncharacterized protein (TIGR02996 family)
VTTEDDFRGALDANPEDWQTRLVFADWLQERGDQRADGYRALGVLRLKAWYYETVEGWGWFHPDWIDIPEPEIMRRVRSSILPPDWAALHVPPRGAGAPGAMLYHATHPTARQAEDAAALAFAYLPAERRAELLAAPPGTASAGG